jgi:hypothetical protein
MAMRIATSLKSHPELGDAAGASNLIKQVTLMFTTAIIGKAQVGSVQVCREGVPWH